MGLEKARSSALGIGSPAWVEDVETVWIEATVVKLDGDAITARTVNGDLVETTMANALPRDEDVTMRGVDDMTKLSYLHEPGVLHNLYTRFKHDEIYTFTGNILIAVNPFTRLPHLFNTYMMKQYQDAQPGDLNPHVYSVADAAYKAMMEEMKSQAILVSGESGAGKTETTKQIMQYLAFVGGRTVGDERSVEQQVLQSNPLLEAFGNAKTVRNNNSSRFGKFVEIQFNNGKISGAAVRTYLLERSRVTQISSPERNYHCFYQLVAGASPEDAERLKLGPPDSFHYLNQSKCVEVGAIDDCKEYQLTREAMDIVGITTEEQEAIFRTIAAVLHLGNIEFDSGESDASEVSTEKSKFHLKAAAEMLMCDEQMLEKSLTTRIMKATRTESITKILNKSQATDNRDSIAKTIYAKLFDWLVNKVNKSIGQDPHSTVLIGVLDIYGFESFEINSFEQFCINLTNEKLQQHFNTHVFKMEQAEYRKEEINWDNIDFVDNIDVLDLIEKKPLGIIALLDEACMLPRSTAESFARKLGDTFNNHRRFSKHKFKRTAFTIDHYAGQVEYRADLFLEKNKDFVVPEHQQLLHASRCAFVSGLFPADEGTKAPSKFMSIGSQFKLQLAALMETLKLTAPHYIRCVKPNMQLKPQIFENKNVLQQLRCSGVLEAVRISCAGFPTRRTFEEFLDRFGLLHPEVLIESAEESADEKVACQNLLEKCNLKGYQIGKTKVFLRAGQMAILDTLRSNVLNEAAVKIQHMVQSFLMRRDYERMKRASLLVQAYWRGTMARMEFRFLREQVSAVCFQRYIRGYLAQKNYFEMRQAAIRIQSAIRSLAARRVLCVLQDNHAATQIQSKWRSYVAFRSYDELLRSCKVFQGAWRCKEARSEIKKLRQAARETGALREAKTRLEKKCEELTLRLGLAKVSLIARNSELAKLKFAMEGAQAQVEQMKILLAKEREGHEADLAQAKVAAAQLLEAEMSAQASKEVLDKVEALSEENSKLKELVEDYEKKKALEESSAKRIEEADLKRDAIQELLNRSEEQVQDLISENQSLQSEKLNLQLDNRILRQQALSMKDLELEKQDLQRNLQHLEANSQALRAENQTLKQQLEQLESQDLQRNLQHLEANSQALRAENQTLKYQLEQLESQDLQRDLQHLEANSQALRAENQTLKQQLEQLESQDLQRNLQHLEANSQALRAENQTLKQQLEQLTSKGGTVLKIGGASSKFDISEPEPAIGETEFTEANSQALRAENQTLKYQLEQLESQDLQRNLQHLEANSQALRAENQTLKQQLEQLESQDLQRTLQHLEANSQALRAENQTLKQQLEQLTSKGGTVLKIGGASSKFDISEPEPAIGETEFTEANSQALRAENQTLKQQLEQLESQDLQRNLQHLEANSQALRAENQTLKQQLEQLESQDLQRNLQHLEANSHALRAENQTLKQQLEQLTSKGGTVLKIGGASSKFDIREPEPAIGETEFTEANSQALRAENQTLKQQLEQLESQDLQRNLQHLEANSQALRAENQTLKQQLEQLESQDLQRNLQHLEANSQALRAENQTLKQQLEQLESQDLQRNLQHLEAKCQALRAENETLKQQLEQLESQDLQRNLQHLEANSQALRAENQTLKQQLEQLTSKGGTVVKIGRAAVTRIKPTPEPVITTSYPDEQPGRSQHIRSESSDFTSLYFREDSPVPEAKPVDHEKSKMMPDKLQYLPEDSPVPEAKPVDQKKSKMMPDKLQYLPEDSPVPEAKPVDQKKSKMMPDKLQSDQEALLDCLMQDVGFSKDHPVAAVIIFKCLLQWHSFEAERTDVFDRIISAIQKAIESHSDNNDVLAYWLSNTSTLLHLLQRTLKTGGGGGTTPRRRRQATLFGRMTQRFSSQQENYPNGMGPVGLDNVRQVEAKYPALLFKQQLSAYVEKIYGMLRDRLKKEITPLLGSCIQAPRAPRHQLVRKLSLTPAQQVLSSHWGSIINSLLTLLNALRGNKVPPYLVRNIFTQIFSFINVQLVNSLLLRRECCSFSNGEYIKAGLAQLEHWIYEAGEEYAGDSWEELRYIRQAVGFLVIHQKPKISLDEIINDLCPALSMQQLYRISTMYWDDKYGTHTVAPEVIQNMRILMTEYSYNAGGNSFLLDDDSGIPFSVDDISKSMPDVDLSQVDPPPLLKNRPSFRFLQPGKA
uniref:Unconventional myosin heavy chain n=1 Tax=Chara corallina TaxID=43696 RepID=Q9SSU1_CHACB|nr:unconventional myosin heavy chain [Chara corallina]